MELLVKINASKIPNANGKSRKVNIIYPVELLAPVTGTVFKGNATSNRLSCFGNRDYSAPTYIDAVVCLTQLYIPFQFNCEKIWGGRIVEITTLGNLEVFRVNKLPSESSFNEYIPINATRWMDMISAQPQSIQYATRYVSAAPTYLCVRSIDWEGFNLTSFTIKFNHITARHDDKYESQKLAWAHMFFVVIAASMYLLPYFISVVFGTYIYFQGMKLYMTSMVFGACIICLGPLMLTRTNRHLAFHYFRYFFTRKHADETKLVIKERLPLFQAVFFSSLLLVVGSSVGYIVHTYCNINREIRNQILRVSLALSAAWLIFFLCRFFQRFVRNWLWISIAIMLARLIDNYVNPMSRNEIFLATMIVMYMSKESVKSSLRLIKGKKLHLRLNAITHSLPPLNLLQLLDWIFLTIQFYRKRRITRPNSSSIQLTSTLSSNTSHVESDSEFTKTGNQPQEQSSVRRLSVNEDIGLPSPLTHSTHSPSPYSRDISSVITPRVSSPQIVDSQAAVFGSHSACQPGGSNMEQHALLNPSRQASTFVRNLSQNSLHSHSHVDTLGSLLDRDDPLYVDESMTYTETISGESCGNEDDEHDDDDDDDEDDDVNGTHGVYLEDIFISAFLTKKEERLGGSGSTPDGSGPGTPKNGYPPASARRERSDTLDSTDFLESLQSSVVNLMMLDDSDEADIVHDETMFVCGTKDESIDEIGVGSDLKSSKQSNSNRDNQVHPSLSSLSSGSVNALDHIKLPINVSPSVTETAVDNIDLTLADFRLPNFNPLPSSLNSSTEAVLVDKAHSHKIDLNNKLIKFHIRGDELNRLISLSCSTLNLSFISNHEDFSESESSTYQQLVVKVLLTSITAADSFISWASTTLDLQLTNERNNLPKHDSHKVHYKILSQLQGYQVKFFLTLIRVSNQFIISDEGQPVLSTGNRISNIDKHEMKILSKRLAKVFNLQLSQASSRCMKEMVADIGFDPSLLSETLSNNSISSSSSSAPSAYCTVESWVSTTDSNGIPSVNDMLRAHNLFMTHQLESDTNNRFLSANVGSKFQNNISAFVVPTLATLMSELLRGIIADYDAVSTLINPMKIIQQITFGAQISPSSTKMLHVKLRMPVMFDCFVRADCSEVRATAESTKSSGSHWQAIDDHIQLFTVLQQNIGKYKELIGCWAESPNSGSNYDTLMAKCSLDSRLLNANIQLVSTSNILTRSLAAIALTAYLGILLDVASSELFQFT